MFKKIVLCLSTILVLAVVWNGVHGNGTITPKIESYHFYRNQLDDGMKEAYDKIEESMLNGERYALVSSDITKSEVKAIQVAILYDHPEILNFNMVSLSYDLKFARIVILGYKDVPLGDAYEAVDSIANGLKEYTTEQQLFKIYELLVGVRYSIEDPEVDNAYGTLVNGTAKCSGVAETMSLMLSKLGITNYVVYVDDFYNGIGHAWNRVYVNGQWCEFDATYDNGKSYDEWKCFGVAKAH